MSALPVLYSFRRCPYAMRARLGILASGLQVELREVVLRDKPVEMLAISPKGTVPVLRLPSGQVLEQSLDIMRWALPHSDADFDLISRNDGEFKAALDRYKYPERFPERTQDEYRNDALPFLLELESRLSKTAFLSGDSLEFLDYAIFPFVRQFASVDRAAFDALSLTHVATWMDGLIQSSPFERCMSKHVPWHPEQEPLVWP